MAAPSTRRRLSGLNPALLPLRTLAFDDQDYSFFTYAGTWRTFAGTGWPGGAYANTVTFRAAVVPSEPTPTADTAIVRFRGTPEEGLDLLGSSEDGGPMSFFIRALDSATNTGWVPFGPALVTYCYRYEWSPTVAQDSRPENVHNYANSFIGQNNYGHLATPGLLQLRGLPAGRYQFRLEKPANTNDLNDNGNRATYFDGLMLYTRA
jgi:hypothetical protein